ncbi:MAG: FAD-binding oxidoreductase [Rhodoferax sp.]|nr:FAD-binding oxidoreductase [Rhodoferax sp.]
MNDYSPLLEVLRQIVGSDNVINQGDLSAWERDWRKRQHGKALAVVRPANTEEVAAVVRACVAAQVSIVPQGGNTGMVLGSIPDDSGTQIVLSLQRMNRVRAIDTANLTITLDAGCVLQSVQEFCKGASYLFPLRMASEGSCTIGGNLSTNAGGTQVVRYGNARELCLGLEVVTPQGAIWDGLTGLRKDNTGYDLRHLIIGSEGTLGVITAAVMKLYPLPRAQLTAFAAVPSLEAAVDLLVLAHEELDGGLSGFEIMGHFALSLVGRHFPHLRLPLQESKTPYNVLIEYSSLETETKATERFESFMPLAMELGYVNDAIVAKNSTEARQLWHIRESIPLAQAQEGLNIKHDIALAASRIAAFVQQTDALLAQAYPGVRLVNYGHLGDGNLHYNVQAPENCDAAAFLQENESAVHALVYAQVVRHQGSISAEHGIGTLKRDVLVQYKSPQALAMMRAIKHALDPLNTMNPGRVIRMDK